MSLFGETRQVRALGDLFANVWQVAYVTHDLDRGMQTLRDRYGVENCTEVPTAGATFLKGDEAVDWQVRVAMGARGGLIVELIEPVAGEVGFYRRFLPEDGSASLRLHHIATQVPLGDDVWGALGDLLGGAGLRFDYAVLIPNRVRAGYIDTTADLGHYLEVCQLQPADTEFFSSLIEERAR